MRGTPWHAKNVLPRRFLPLYASQDTLDSNRADWIRTSDLLNPIQAHYQAVLRPDILRGAS